MTVLGYRNGHCAAGRCVAGGVVQQVRHDLRHAVGIDVQPHRMRGEHCDERVARRLDIRPCGFHSVSDDGNEVRAQLAYLNAVTRKTSGIEQVIDQPYELLHLSLDDGQMVVVVAIAGLEQPERETDRREWIPQLVRQRRQELALA